MRYGIPTLLLTAALLGACSYEDATDDQAATSETPAAAASESSGFSVPETGVSEYDADRLAQQRLDPSWRPYAERDRLERMGQLRGQTVPPDAGAPMNTDMGTEMPLTTSLEPPPPPGAEGGRAPSPPAAPRRTTESLDNLNPQAMQGPPALPVPREGGGPSVLKAQIMLDRARFSPGAIDGNWGKNTEKAVFWFQFSQNLPTTGEIDRATWDALVRAAGGQRPPLKQITVTAENLAGPFTEVPEDMYAKAKLECLCYASPLEMFAEQGHAEPGLIQKLNPGVDFAALQPGAKLWIPDVPPILPLDAGQAKAQAQQAKTTPATGTPAPPAGNQATPGQAGGQIAKLLVAKRGFYLQALDAQGKILYHFPTTLGSKYDQSASGTHKVTGIHPNPDFHYQPKLFADKPDTDPEAHLKAGPNSPVGLVWMALSKPHHGIHGTAVPETIGYTSSHGCVRLTNWDAVFLSQKIKPGVQVAFRE